MWQEVRWLQERSSYGSCAVMPEAMHFGECIDGDSWHSSPRGAATYAVHKQADGFGRVTYTSEDIWSDGTYNAFTDLTRYDGDWFLVFRTASTQGIPLLGNKAGRSACSNRPTARHGSPSLS